MNPYHVLEVAFDADIAVLRASFRRLARAHHPDRAQNDAERALASERMVKINWAWHVLSDAERRAAFDARWRLEQLENARRAQEALRDSARRQNARHQQSHLADVLKAQAQRTPQQNSPAQSQKTRNQNEERARQARARAEMTRPVRQPLTREEKKRQSLARARLQRMRREDQRRSSSPSARRQLAEASRLFAQEGRASDAIAICHDVLRVDFRNVPARELLGDFYLRLGRQDRALPLWEQALELQPDNASIRRKLHALRPHDPRSYAPQPGIPRRETPSATAREMQSKARSQTPESGFWGRVCAAFRSGL